jgi:ABC-2 type transport system permease protein
MNVQTLAQERSLGRIYALEARYELLKLVRMPAYLVPMLAFPLVFYLLFGVAMANRAAGKLDIARYLLATYGSFGVMGVALFGFGVGVAIERGQGWMLFKRATPMPPLAYFLGKLATCLLFSTVLVCLLFSLGATAGGVRLPAATWTSLAGVLVAGAIPFAAFGLALGYWAGPNSAPATVNLIYLPAAFLSGMWMPINMLPDILQRLAPWLPTYHYAQLALGRLGFGREPAGRSVAVLAVFTVSSLLLAWRGYRRDEGKTFG